jgi:hypothetical protein
VQSYGVVLGAAVGRAFVLGPNVAATPAVGYSLVYTAQAGSPPLVPTPPIRHVVEARVPIAISLTRHVFLKPAFSAGVTIDEAGSWAFFGSISQRLGVMF